MTDTASDLRGLRVLVVEDEPDTRESLATLLRMCGADARVAADGPSALAVAEAYRPDAAVVDLGLPRLDGWEVARRLSATASPPVLVAVSGYASDADRRRSRDAGFDAHLAKPAAFDEVVAVLLRRAGPA